MTAYIDDAARAREAIRQFNQQKNAFNERMRESADPDNLAKRIISQMLFAFKYNPNDPAMTDLAPNEIMDSIDYLSKNGAFSSFGVDPDTLARYMAVAYKEHGAKESQVALDRAAKESELFKAHQVQTRMADEAELNKTAKFKSMDGVNMGVLYKLAYEQGGVLYKKDFVSSVWDAVLKVREFTFKMTCEIFGRSDDGTEYTAERANVANADKVTFKNLFSDDVNKSQPMTNDAWSRTGFFSDDEHTRKLHEIALTDETQQCNAKVLGMYGRQRNDSGAIIVTAYGQFADDDSFTHVVSGAYLLSSGLAVMYTRQKNADGELVPVMDGDEPAVYAGGSLLLTDMLQIVGRYRSADEMLGKE